MSIPVNKTNPIWLATLEETDGPYSRTVRYYKQLYLAWPDWCPTHPGFTAINAAENMRKSNSIWPDMWMEQQSLGLECCQIYQREMRV